MSISAASISHALRDIGHHGVTRPRGSTNGSVTFGQQLGTAAGQVPGTTVQQSVQPQQPHASGSLLSADMLRAIQTIE